MSNSEIPDDFIKALAYQAAKDSPAEVQKGQYRCAMCGDIFDFHQVWTNEDALKEAQQNGFDLEKIECVIVCDDCYKKTPWGMK